jgi:DNA-binding Lrp family transcriptional regulator
MDEIDRRLIGLLRRDARLPVASLAKSLRMSRGAIQNRIERMIARRDIQGFTVRLSGDADVHRVRAIMAIAVEGERSAAVLKALRSFPEIEAVHMTNGRWDMIAEVATDSLEGFSAMLDRARLIEGISATETSLLLKTHRM